MRNITKQLIENYKIYLINNEKANATVRKYIFDIKQFMIWANGGSFGKEDVLKYKFLLMEKYAATGANSILSSLNSFFRYCEWHELYVKLLKVQKCVFSNQKEELTKEEYKKLLMTAKRKKKEQLYWIMQTICSTGIRVSELCYITAEALESGKAEVSCKSKRRIVFLPKKLCEQLKAYIKGRKIKSGSVFITKNGNPLDRSNIWSEMKKLCTEAGVSSEKVFPHNLRHLFARTYYSVQKDIVRLADILGHSNINTTRIYTMESGEIHRAQIQKLGLLLC